MSDAYACAEEAAEGARQHLAQRYAPFGIQPKIYQIEACGLKVVCLPWSHTKRNAALKAIPKDLHEMAAGMKYIEARVVDTIWWIEGQPDAGPIVALKHVRNLADLGGPLGDLFMKIAGACDEEDKEAGAPK